ncbi:MAG TPA: MupA/Atu3671 family FMN-dependent luciferase-like monooxygenase [Thermoanaerobaculia bacterium]|nr:MupA/Atu3671 family FMN-dependent luciferase-like monooxygenase [Thermoanaerobaculia bacterium]
MDFGLMFFSSVAAASPGGAYRLLTEAARFADERGFRCVWTPERHFHPFGGLFPNPSVLGAALAMITRRIEIRAGSLVAPLHDVLRIAEDWSVVDNLSGGRAAISFGSGWNIEDFVLRPEVYSDRQAHMYHQIEEVRALWRGERLARRDSNGREVRIGIYPRPVQAELPVWVTSSGNVRTFESAGAIGANLLTHLIGQTLDQAAEKIRSYREARSAHGLDPDAGKVALMLHTFLGSDLDAAREKARTPFREYLRSALSLEQLAAAGGGAISGGHRIAAHEIPPAALEELLDLTFERYAQSASLLGTPESCRELLWQAEDAGIDEIACLIDFLDDNGAVLAGLEHLDEVRAAFSTPALEAATEAAASSFLEEL